MIIIFEKSIFQNIQNIDICPLLAYLLPNEEEYEIMLLLTFDDKL